MPQFASLVAESELHRISSGSRCLKVGPFLQGFLPIYAMTHGVESFSFPRVPPGWLAIIATQPAPPHTTLVSERRKLIAGVKGLLFPAPAGNMVVKLTAVVLVLLSFPLGVTAGDTAGRATPIMVELFTSEGCSDCPPADAFLEKLDQQPFSRAQMIVLSEHVDYWNHDGWKDPFSSHFFSERQQEYASEFGLQTVYTPQMVVDGSSEFVGGNQGAASKAFTQAAAAPKIDLRLSALQIDPANTLHAHLEAAALPKGEKGDVYIAIALNRAESQVSAGENSGHKLSHTAVVRSLTKIGSLQKEQPFAQDLRLPVPQGVSADNLRLIAFVQKPHQGAVLGATMQLLSK